MAYDEVLADRIRAVVEDVAGPAESAVSEKKMFGGLAFLVDGRMAVCAARSGGGGVLMVRVEPERRDELCTRPHARPMEMRGRAMRGWLRVDADGVPDDAALENWVRPAVTYARSLPG